MKKKTINKRKVMRDAIGLDYAMAKYAVPRLKWLEKNSQSYPTEMASLEEWKAIIKKIRLAFQEYIDYNEGVDEISIEHRKAIIKEGLDLFATYYMDLWS